jgi:hypothetical protein
MERDTTFTALVIQNVIYIVQVEAIFAGCNDSYEPVDRIWSSSMAVTSMEKCWS